MTEPLTQALISGGLIGSGLTAFVALVVHGYVTEDSSLDEPIWQYGSKGEPWTEEAISGWFGRIDDD